MRLLKRFAEWFRAWQRRERRVAAYGVRGRVFEKKPSRGGGAIGAAGKPQPTIRARVYRAATGKWEDHGVVAKPKE
jgi:hypothetical protein